MSEQFKQEPKNKSIEIPFEEIPNEAPLRRDIRRLDWEIDEAEATLKVEDREKAKEYLPKVYDDLIKLNKRDKKDWQTLWIWNPDGYLSEEEFNRLNIRRKLLSNAIGIMTDSGEIRHDLNEI